MVHLASMEGRKKDHTRQNKIGKKRKIMKLYSGFSFSKGKKLIKKKENKRNRESLHEAILLV